MSNSVFELDAEVRHEAGKGASRRLRRLADKVPAIVYGDEKTPTPISVSHKELVKHLGHEAFYSHVITLHIDGKSESVILKDLQRHPSKNKVWHADFLRVSQSKKITMSVPLHFLNEENCTGVKLGGGIITHMMTQLEITCLPSNLPEFIEVDVAELKVGQVYHISDLKMPEGVQSTSLIQGEDHDLPVVNVTKTRGSAAGDEESAEGEEGES